MHFDEIRDHEPECIKCNTPMKVFSDGSVIGHRKIYHELADSIGSIHELILICPNCKTDTSADRFYHGDRDKYFKINWTSEDGSKEGTEFVEVQYEYCPKCGYFEVKPTNGIIRELAKRSKTSQG